LRLACSSHNTLCTYSFIVWSIREEGAEKEKPYRVTVPLDFITAEGAHPISTQCSARREQRYSIQQQPCLSSRAVALVQSCEEIKWKTDLGN
jgi:hypothetical protein